MQRASDEISLALQNRNRLIGLTASFNKIDPQTFADNRQLRKLDTPDWQVVFGRRGAGKTTLLATYAQYITKADRIKYASIELNVPDFISVVESDSGKKIKDSIIAKIYFDDFIRVIADHVYNVFTSQNTNSKFYRRFQISEKKRHIEDIVLELKKSTASVVETEFGGATKVTTKTKEHASSTNKVSGRLDAGIGVDATGLPHMHLGLNGHTNRGSEQEASEDRLKSVAIKNFKLNYSRTRQLIEELLDALGLEKLYIFIDEWSELDRTGTTTIQPHFADLIKRVFWKNPKFVFKLGAVRNHTRLTTSLKAKTIVGLELGADIFEINLDDAYVDGEINKIAFFEELIFRHLAACNKNLLDFQREGNITPYGTPGGRPIDTFITHIFKNRDVFKTLVIGAGNLPRDFIEMFDAIAQRRNFSVVPTWTLGEIKSAIKTHYLSNKQSTIKGDNELEDICKKIMRLVKSNKCRLIIVPAQSDLKIIRATAVLYHKRLIHDVNMNEIPPLLRNTHEFYYADLGLEFDVSREKFEDLTEQIDVCPLAGDEEEDSVQQFILK